MQNFNMNVIFTAYHVGTKAVLGVTDEERGYLDIYMMLYQGRAPYSGTYDHQCSAGQACCRLDNRMGLVIVRT